MIKIVHIEDFFHPDAGYQINILTKFQAANNYDVTILTAEIKKIPERLFKFFGIDDIEIRDKNFTNKTGVKIIRLPILKYYSGRAIYTFKLLSILRKIQPDILFIHGNDSFAGILFTIFYRYFHFSIIMDNHMLEMASVNKLNKIFRWWYRTFISSKIIKNQIKVIKVVEDDYVNKQLGIPINLTPIIPLGTDSSIFYPDTKKKEKLRDFYNINKKDFVLLYIGKITSDKGVDILAKACMKKFYTNRKIVLIIVGTISSIYGYIVESMLKLSQNIILRFPTQNYYDLNNFYNMADAVVFPRHCSLSFFDAQACGLPVIAERNSVNLERLKFGNGLLFNSNDYNDLRMKIEYLANLSANDYLKLRNNALNFIKNGGYDYSLIERKYHKEITESIERYLRSKGK